MSVTESESNFMHGTFNDRNILFSEMLPASIAQYRNFKIHSPPPPQPAKPRVLTILCARGVGNLTSMAFPWPGVGNLTFT